MRARWPRCEIAQAESSHRDPCGLSASGGLGPVRSCFTPELPAERLPCLCAAYNLCSERPTDGYTARQHLDTVKSYAPEIHFDFVVVNNQPASEGQRARYAAEGAHQIGLEGETFDDSLDGEAQVVRAPLLDEGEKARHDSLRLANVVFSCWQQSVSQPAVSA